VGCVKAQILGNDPMRKSGGDGDGLAAADLQADLIEHGRRDR
jgi:hypothetical protein